MLISFSLFYLFSSLAILSSFFVISTKNPVFSILFLIFTFSNVSCILFLFNFEFLPVSFLVIYVGAIAVLFLFVLMMLNIKLSELQQTYSTMIPIAVIFSLVFMFEIIFLFRTEFTYINSFSEESTFYLAECLNKVSSNTDLNNLFGTYTNIKTIALAIFTDYLYAFLVSAYVLLIAMIAAIILTLQKSFVSKTQDIYSQLMADYERTLVYYS